MPRPMGVCTECGGSVHVSWSSAPPERRKCHSCRRVARQRTCGACGEVFFKKSGSDQTYCSLVCSRSARDTTPKEPRVCVGCGTDVFSTANIPRCQLCLEAWRSTPEFKAPRNKIWRDKARRRNALKLSLPTERYTTEEIAERDESVCGLCHKSVDMKLSGRAKWGPTIDHVIPISKGGPDTRDNVQLAHRHCNVIKGDKAL